MVYPFSLSMIGSPRNTGPFVGSYSSISSNTSFTTGSYNIGTPSADRFIVFAFDNIGGVGGPSDILVNGSSPDSSISPSSKSITDNLSWWIIRQSTGSSVTFTFDFATSCKAILAHIYKINLPNASGIEVSLLALTHIEDAQTLGTATTSYNSASGGTLTHAGGYSFMAMSDVTTPPLDATKTTLSFNGVNHTTQESYSGSFLFGDGAVATALNLCSGYQILGSYPTANVISTWDDTGGSGLVSGFTIDGYPTGG